jgi:hypothetical protein
VRENTREFYAAPADQPNTGATAQNPQTELKEWAMIALNVVLMAITAIAVLTLLGWAIQIHERHGATGA